MRSRAIGLLALAAAACAPVAPLPVADWRAPLGREHPLAGRVWDTAAGRSVTPDALVARLAAARFVLLGESHDNPDHHRLQSALVRALLAAGRRPAVAFEMLTADQAPALARYLATRPTDAGGLGAAVDWPHSGWPDWSHYQPIAQAALDAGVPIVAANLPTATVRALARGQRPALPAGLAATYGLDGPLPPPAHASLAEDIRAAHCGHAPPERVEAMVLAQRARDAEFAERLVAGQQDGAVLIAGAGHVRTDRGVPAALRRRLPGAPIASVAFVEVRAGWDRPADYRAAFGGALPFDWMWFTPRMDVDDADPCERFRRSLERLRAPR
jgi:uncharacterized iron-regulated protein